MHTSCVTKDSPHHISSVAAGFCNQERLCHSAKPVVHMRELVECPGVMIFSQQFENCPVVLRTIVPLIGKIGNILAYNFLANASQRQLAEELRACQTHTGRTRATTKGASKRTCSKHVDTFNVGVPNSQGQSRKDWTAYGVRNFKN